MTIILSFSDTASLSSMMICCATVVIFNVSLLYELTELSDFLLWKMLLHGVPQAFLVCLP
jgi:hypothetical protein